MPTNNPPTPRSYPIRLHGCDHDAAVAAIPKAKGRWLLAATYSRSPAIVYAWFDPVSGVLSFESQRCPKWARGLFEAFVRDAFTVSPAVVV